MGPLLTLKVHTQLLAALQAGERSLGCSLDLDLSTTSVDVDASVWYWQSVAYPYPTVCKDRTIYYWSGVGFEPVAHYSTSLIKLVPTPWGPPTFEIDGIKMLPTAKVSPYEDAQRKVALIQPRNKIILDTCGGLGYFAAWCLRGDASRVLSFEKNADVLWLRTLNPWSPQHHAGSADSRLSVAQADVTAEIVQMPANSVDAILHDPPRFGIAGELYSQVFYDQLARVLRRGGRLFHYTGTPNRLTSGRDVPAEVSRRLQDAGFSTQFNGDGVLAVKRKS